MNLKLPQLIGLTIGGVLLYAAIKNVSPLDVLKAALTGKPMPTPGDALPARTNVVDGNGDPTGGWINGDGQYIPPTDSTQQQPQAPGTAVNVPTVYKKPYTVVSV